MKSYILSLVLLVTGFLPLATGQTLSQESRDFLTGHALRIEPDEDVLTAEWKSIFTQLADKRFILLGEFNHGSRQVFLLRNQIIKHLHEELGFDVIFFESGLGELVRIDQEKDQRTPAQMTYGFFSGWRTAEFRSLMEYVKAENIAVAGYDVQRTGGTFESFFTEMLLIAGMDTTRFGQLEQEYGAVARQLRNRRVAYDDSLQQRVDQLIRQYQNCRYQFIHIQVKVPLRESLLFLRTLENRIDFLNYMLAFKQDEDWNKRWAARDSIMAANVTWLSENLYSQQKIIVVGHNFHVAKYNEREEVMGEYLARQYAEEMYSIGMFAGAGVFANNGGEAETMSAPDPEQLDIKHIIENLDGTTHFLPIPAAAVAGDQWLREPIIVNDTFIDLSSSHSLILARHFDGLFLLDRVSLPQK